MSQHSHIIDDGYPSDVAEFINSETNLTLNCDEDDLKILWLSKGRILAVNETQEWVLIIRTQHDEDSGVHHIIGWRPYHITNVNDMVYLPVTAS